MKSSPKKSQDVLVFTLLGVGSIVWGLYMLFKRWVLWQWDSGWGIEDVLFEPLLPIIGAGALWHVHRSTLDKLKFGDVVMQSSPSPARLGETAELFWHLPKAAVVGQKVTITVRASRIYWDGRRYTTGDSQSNKYPTTVQEDARGKFIQHCIRVQTELIKQTQDPKSSYDDLNVSLDSDEGLYRTYPLAWVA
jgi:hypothetical protein